MNYRLVYDVTTAGPSAFSVVFLVFTVGLTVGAIVLVRKPQLLKGKLNRGLLKRAPPPIKAWALLAFALIFIVFALGLFDSGRSELQRIAKRGGCTSIEGRVTDYHLTKGRRYRESFGVDGVHFEYSEGAVTGAFNDTAWRRGPIKPDLPVRICYYASERLGENLILKLEIGS